MALSFLELSGGLSGKSSSLYKPSGWEVLAPWTTKARMEATEREQKREFYITHQEQQRIGAAEAQKLQQEKQQRASEQKALEDLRTRVILNLQQLEDEAVRTTDFVVKIRELSQDPELRGVNLEEIDADLVEMEKAVVAIQAGTVINTGTFDTDELAKGLSDASSGLVAMRTVTARAIRALKALEQEIQFQKDEQIRQDLAEVARAERAATEARKQRQLEDQRRSENEWRAAEAARKMRRDLMGQILEVDRELSNEKRRLGNLRVELANLRFQKSESSRRRAAGLGRSR
jgi:hypothetical protein